MNPLGVSPPRRVLTKPTFLEVDLATRFKACLANGCNSNSHYSGGGACGYCKNHYRRWRKYGDPYGGGTVRGDPLAWLIEHADYKGTDCLPWPFARLKSGYGSIRTAKRCWIASRLMCTVAHGPAPSMWHEAAHSCGKGHEACMNQNHLRWATPAENQADRVIHGTDNRGEKQGSSRMTEFEIRAIRSLEGVLPQKEIAEIFGVYPSHVSQIINRNAWGWLI